MAEMIPPILDEGVIGTELAAEFTVAEFTALDKLSAQG
jgi:hypothetical protein